MTTAQFNVIALAGCDFLVEGTDFRGRTGETVIAAPAWVDYKATTEVDTAKAEFDAAIREFYAPVLDATSALREAREQEEYGDPLSVILLDEGTPASAGSPRRELHLDPGSKILRAIEEGLTDRLIWVGDELALTAPDALGVESDDNDDDGTVVTE